MIEFSFHIGSFIAGLIAGGITLIAVLVFTW